MSGLFIGMVIGWVTMFIGMGFVGLERYCNTGESYKEAIDRLSNSIR